VYALKRLHQTLRSETRKKESGTHEKKKNKTQENPEKQVKFFCQHVRRINLETETARVGNYERTYDSPGKTHVVYIISVVETEHMGSHGRKNETACQAEQNTCGNTGRRRKASSKRKITHKWRESRTEQGYKEIIPVRGFLVKAEQVNAGKNRPDIEDILAEKGKSRHCVYCSISA